MLLKTALRIHPGHIVAFTGAGGKSSAIRRLAREWAPETPVIVSTTTRIGLEQADLAAHHLIAVSPADLRALTRLLEEHRTVLVTGPALKGEGKWPGIVDSAQLDRLRTATKHSGALLLMEADGARGRSLKAPAGHEPAVPAFADVVVPVAGLDAVGAALDSKAVHRPARVSGLLGLPEGSVLEPRHLAQVLSHNQGGLKGVSHEMQTRVLLNKAEDHARREAGLEVADALLASPRIQSVLLSELAADPPVFEARGRVAGIVLAAGSSSRLGIPKQLIAFRGRPLVWHAVRAALDGGLSPVVVVCGAAGSEVRLALEETPVTLVDNPLWESGQSTSVRQGLLAAEGSGIEGAVFLLADMPLVTGALVRELLSVHRRTLAPLVAPRAGGRRANPVLFDRSTFPALGELEGDQGGRSLFRRFNAEWIDWNESAMLDLDTPEDLERLKALQ